MISAVVLTHNDESGLGRTLESLKWVDELIVVDDESIDKTKEVARKFTNKIYSHALNNDFAAQRNFGLEKATGEWVLFVDSDEVVSEELREEIQQITSNKLRDPSDPPAGGLGMTNISGYYVKRKDWMWGKWLEHGETSRVKLLRLAKKNSGKWLRAIHEVWEVKGETGELKNSLLHYPHPNVAQFLTEINHYSTLNAKYFYEQGIRSSWWQIIVYPKAKFLVNYFLYLGFLDGTAGAVMAIMMSFHSFLTRAKLYVLQSKT